MSERREDRLRLNRRQFLIALSALLANGALVACGALDSTATGGASPRATATLMNPLQSPVPLEGASPVATAQAGSAITPEEFRRLSSLLTGFDELEPTLARVYLSSLQANAESAATLAELYEQAALGSESPPTSVEELAESGLFDGGGVTDLADQIIGMWYSGLYPGEEGDQVATYVDALAWKSVSYTKASSLCGPHMGFWSDRPDTIRADRHDDPLAAGPTWPQAAVHPRERSHG